jgi:hypothetical protein
MKFWRILCVSLQLRKERKGPEADFGRSGGQENGGQDNYVIPYLFSENPWVRIASSVLSATDTFHSSKPLAESTLEAMRTQERFHCFVASLTAISATPPMFLSAIFPPGCW